MAWWRNILANVFGRRSGSTMLVRGRYDAAQTTEQNQRFWAYADLSSAESGNSPSVRATLRARSRYIAQNNAYAAGMLQTLAHHTIGVGPRLQIDLGDDRLNQRIEAMWNTWSAAVDLAGKLRTMTITRARDGEAFALLTTSQTLPTSVQLTLQLIDAERVTSPDLITPDKRRVDGIRLNEIGEPVAYEILRDHPYGPNPSREVIVVPAARVMHWFRQDRPEQYRGVPELAPALIQFEHLTRFTRATLTAAEAAASFALVFKTTMPPGGSAAPVEPGTMMDIEQGAAIFIPEGWEAEQVKTEQPNSQYEMIIRTLVREIARALCMPYHVAACDATGANFASGQLDAQPYYRAIEVARDALERQLDKVLVEFMREAAAVLNVELPSYPSHEWYWPAIGEHTDPSRVADATSTLYQAGLTTAKRHYATEGADWQREFEQRAREWDYLIDYATGRGLTLEQAFAFAMGKVPPIAPGGGSITRPTGGNNGKRIPVVEES